MLRHSYGAVVCGRAAGTLHAEDLAVTGSPGMIVDSVSSLGTSARVWAGLAAADWVARAPNVRVLGLGFGPDPAEPAFGARRLDTGAGGHSDYFTPGSRSLRNLTRIAIGDIGGVTS